MSLFRFLLIPAAALSLLVSACNTVPQTQSGSVKPAAVTLPLTQPRQPPKSAAQKTLVKQSAQRLSGKKTPHSIHKKRKQIPPADKKITSNALVISHLEYRAGTINIQWSVLNHPQIAAFRLYRLEQGVDDGFQLLARLGRSRQYYLDDVADRGAKMSYQVSAVDQQGQELARSAARSAGSFSARRLLNVRLKLSLKHHVTGAPELQWLADQGTDLRGYLVFRAAQDSDHWQTVSALLRDSHFVDRSARSGQKYRYRLRLLLTRGRYSVFSTPVDWVD